MNPIKRRIGTIQERTGVTLMEMMIVVGIVGLLASIAMANIMANRDRAQKYLCVANLRQLDNYKFLWAMDNNKPETETIQIGDLVPVYLKSTPYCPLDLEKQGYVLTMVSDKPKCPKNPADHSVD